MARRERGGVRGRDREARKRCSVERRRVLSVIDSIVINVRTGVGVCGVAKCLFVKVGGSRRKFG